MSPALTRIEKQEGRRVASEVLAYQGVVAAAWSWLPVWAICEMAAVTAFAVNLLVTFAWPRRTSGA